jgi:hypothetical protein
MLEILKNDFFLLSKNRDIFDTRIFLEIDSGIIEAAYTSIAFPQILSSAGINFPGNPCETPDDLISKYAVYCISSRNNCLSENMTARKIQKLHATVMAMKVDDDEEDRGGGSFDRIVGLPSFALRAEQESKVTGKSTLSILREVKKEYIEIASKSLFDRTVVNGAVLLSHVSGILKDGKGCNEVSPTDDLWQLEPLTYRFFTPESTTLRHNLEKSAIIYRAFSK